MTEVVAVAVGVLLLHPHRHPLLLVLSSYSMVWPAYVEIAAVVAAFLLFLVTWVQL